MVKQKKLMLSSLYLILLLLIAFLVCFNKYNKEIDYSECRIRLVTTDKAIMVYVDQLPRQIESVAVKIYDSLGKKVAYTLTKDSYCFSTGLHGELYSFSVKSRGFFIKRFELLREDRLFVDYSMLGAFPLLEINTFDTDYLNYELYDKPSDFYWGLTVKNNNYSKGAMKFTRFNETVEQELKIKVRGNMTATLDKKSYKIVLNYSEDLLSLGDEYADKEWALLNCGETLNTYYGLCVSEIVGLEWTPRMMFTNLIINGDWKGCYLLIETVKVSKVRVNIGKYGFIVEDDAYWWSEDVFFRTDNMTPQMAYTVKYPDNIKSGSDSRVDALTVFFQEIENRLIEKDLKNSNIDESSFIKWILSKDILGTLDAGGSNIYYYCDDFFLDTSNSKVKMGPLWDFESDFSVEDAWSNSRYDNGTFFEELFKNTAFYNSYVQEWLRIKDVLIDSINNSSSRLIDEYGFGLEESWRLDSLRWDNPNQLPLKESINFYSQWFVSRREWINSQLET